VAETELLNEVELLDLLADMLLIIDKVNPNDSSGRSLEQAHVMARTSALYTVKRLGKATRKDVSQQQGVAELCAKKALEDLVRQGTLVKRGIFYMEAKK